MQTWNGRLGSLLVAGLALATDPIPVTPGQFEITLTMSMGGQAMTSTRTRCILPGDLEDPELVFSQESARNLPRTWTISGLTVGGGKISYVVTPKDLPPATVSGTVSAEAFSVERTVKGAPGASRIVGKRVGDCKK
jgi:hypothetical protein